MDTTNTFEDLFKKLPRPTQDFLLSDSIDIYSQLLAEEHKLTPEVGLDIEDLIRNLLVGVLAEKDLKSAIHELDNISEEKETLILDDILRHVKSLNTSSKNSKEPSPTPKEVAPNPTPETKSQPLPNPPAPPKAPTNPFEAKLKETFSKEKSKEIFSKKDSDSPEEKLPPAPKKPPVDPYRESQ